MGDSLNIIFVSNRLAKAQTLRLSHWQSAFLLFAALSLFLLSSAGLGYAVLTKLNNGRAPWLQKLAAPQAQLDADKSQNVTQQRLSTIAVKVGEMQAQVMRLEALGDRVARAAGIKKEELNFDRKPGRGGPLIPSSNAPLSMEDIQLELAKLSVALEDKADQLIVMDSVLAREQVRRAALPSGLPVNRGFFSSNFGWRIDPFTGQRALHEGVDFMAEMGTPIKAAASGRVVYSDIHSGYGNMIEIDHGNGLISRYAHASKRLVKVGDVVLRGQKIGEVGSTGRSTGPHLHFEVLSNGTPQNPTRYLNLPG